MLRDFGMSSAISPVENARQTAPLRVKLFLPRVSDGEISATHRGSQSAIAVSQNYDRAPQFLPSRPDAAINRSTSTRTEYGADRGTQLPVGRPANCALLGLTLARPTRLHASTMLLVGSPNEMSDGMVGTATSPSSVRRPS